MCSADAPRARVATSAGELLEPVLTAVTDARSRHRHPLVVLIDGPSGAGKSTLADALLARWPAPDRPSLVRMDDIYPGWNGLEQAARHLTRNVLEPHEAGLDGRWQRHDWDAGRGAEWYEVDSARPLIAEGCGTLRAANVPLSDVRVWLDADDVLRKERALARDGAVFAEHWDHWQRQWAAWCASESPERQATICLRARIRG